MKASTNLSDTANTTVDKAATAINSVIDDAASRTKPIVGRVADMAKDATGKAAEVKDQALDWVSAQGDQLSATQKKVVDNTAKYVAANPFKALGIAVAAALIVGRLMR